MVKKKRKKFDIIFLDPPFKETNLLKNTIKLLHEQKYINQNSIIYIERHKKNNNLNLPYNWIQIKKKTSGNVTYSLYIYQNI